MSDLIGGWKVFEGVIKASFGPGPLGRIGTVMIALFVVVGVVALAMVFHNEWLAFVLVVLIIVLAAAFLCFAFRFAFKYPEISAMGDGELAQVLTHQPAVAPLPGMPKLQLEAPLTPNPQLIEAPAAQGDADV